MRDKRWLPSVAAAAIFLCSNLVAQTAGTGAISGTVRDASRAVIPGVSARLENLQTREARDTVSDERGSYSFGFLSPGRYRIEFSLTGFKTVVREGISVAVTERVTVDEALEVASQKETVTVTAAGEIVQASSTSLGRVVDTTQVASLPLVTRNFTQLTALSPGVTASLPDSLAVGNGSQNVFSNGATQTSNSYTLDGVDANNPYGSSAVTDVGVVGVVVPSIDSIQEFKVQTSLFDASFGRKTGANINLITKSGTSEFHGSAYEFFRNDALNANSFFFNSVGVPRPRLRQNQFGGTFGGPVLKDRTFFFVSYEGMRQLNGASLSSTSTLILPAVPQDRSASSLGAAFAGQTGRNGGLAIAADGSNIHPVALALLNAKLPSGDFLIPSPQRSGPGVNYAVSVPANYDQDQFRINIDHQLSAKNRLSARYLNATSFREEAFTQQVSLPGFTATSPADNQNVVLADVHVFGPNTINEARVGYSRFAGATASVRSLKDADLGIFRSTQQDIPGLPRINVQGAFAIGNPPNETDIVANGFSLADTLSFRWRRHELRVGSDSRKDQSNTNITVTQQGFMVLQSFPDLLLGRAGTAIAAGGNGTTSSNINQVALGNGISLRGARIFEQAFFVADDWKLSSRLTLNLGLRYEFLGNFSDNRGLTSNFDPRLYQVPPAGGVSSAGFAQPENTDFPVAGVPLVSKTLVDSEDKNNFAPRFGFAYRPLSSLPLVLRGGFGIYYERLAGRPLITALGQGGPPLSQRFQLAGAANAQATLARPFPVVPALSEFPIRFEIPSPTAGRTPLQFQFIDPFVRTPYVGQYNLNLQYAFTPNLLLEGGYVGSKGTRLLTSLQFNQALLASPSRPINGVTTNSAANAGTRVPFVGFAPTGLNATLTTGTSNYNSLQASLTRRFARGLSFLASYTWSKVLTTVDGAQDNTNIRGQAYGLANFDRAHRFVFSYVYDLPSPAGSGFGNRILGGWQAAGIVTLQSGGAFSVNDARGGTLYGLAGSRASYAPGASIDTAIIDGSVHSRLTRFFNTSAFASAPAIAAGGQTPDGFPVSAAGTLFGNTGRNILRGPDQRNVDFALVKRTKITERVRLEFRSEFFNVFNNVNFGNPGTDVSNPATFGVIDNTTSAPRVIQFALKLGF